MSTSGGDLVALIDLDGTLADYDEAMRREMRAIQAPDESPFDSRHSPDAPHVDARRKLIHRQPGFWRDLQPISLGFEVVEELRALHFVLHVLTKGPTSTPSAWSEKLEWCQRHLPDATVTVTGDKSLVYGRVLFDDYPPFFLKWLAVRPRGLVVCLPHPWNEDFEKGGAREHPNVLRFDGTDRAALREALRRARDRMPGEAS
jgi:5'(3')-deoxyribonucleotidase